MIYPDGAIKIGIPNVTITQRMTRDDFLASPLFAVSKPMNQNAPWSRYSFRPVTADGEHFAGDVCFYDGVLYSLSLCSIRPEFGSSWNDYSVEKERAAHCFHKELLKRIFGRPPDKHIPRGADERDADAGYILPWGEVWASTDIKSAICDILVKYAGAVD